MTQESNHDYQQRLRDHARQLWESEGRPTGREAEYLEKAREVLAMEDNPTGATEPLEKSSDRVLNLGGEPPEALENQGEFPGRTDQGKDTPEVPRRRRD